MLNKFVVQLLLLLAFFGALSRTQEEGGEGGVGTEEKDRSLPFPQPRSTNEQITNAGFTLLERLGKSYNIDLHAPGFEESFARELTVNDTDLLLLHVTGSKKVMSQIYIELQDMLTRRYTNMTLNKNDASPDFASEASIWLFLAGHAYSSTPPVEVDEQIKKLVVLADKAIYGTPFYPKSTVVDLMEGALSRMHEDLSPLIRTLGESVLAKGIKARKEQQQASGGGQDVEDVLTPAEYFQFWTELCFFAETNLGFSDVLKRPVTLHRTDAVTVTLTNLRERAGPLLLHQIKALAGFLEARIQADKAVNAAPAAMASNITIDSKAFFTGFCKITHDNEVLKLALGRRHISCPTRFAEFQLLVDNFRNTRDKVLGSMKAFESTLFGKINHPIDESDKYHLPHGVDDGEGNYAYSSSTETGSGFSGERGGGGGYDDSNALSVDAEGNTWDDENMAGWDEYN